MLTCVLLAFWEGAELCLVPHLNPAHTGREITTHAEACGCESLVMGSRGLGLSKKALMTMLGVGSGGPRVPV